MRRPPHDENSVENAEAESVLGPGHSTMTRRLEPRQLLSGRFRIEAFVAGGGMGQVYRAHDLELDVPVALKTIHPEIASEPASLRRFKREVLLARSVTHANVCRIYDLWHDDVTQATFLTMEFLSGQTVGERIRARGPFSPEDALPLVHQMCIALDAAHRAGVVHRDFKSSNVILVPDGGGYRAVITDFGVAISVEPHVAARRSTMGGEARIRNIDAGDVTERLNATQASSPGIVGTPAYMSPEQVVGGPTGPQSDLYALGVVIFEMRTGRLPFRGASPIETALARLRSDPPSPSTFADVDEVWERVILRLLSRDPGDRFPTAREVVSALEREDCPHHEIRHSLPAERDTFLGREEELADLGSRLEGPETGRLVTLQGAGGTGKTRLAQRYGWESLVRWPGGVWFCDLSEARSPDGIARTVAEVLDVPSMSGDTVTRIGHVIAARQRCLFVLDNLEQAIDHVESTLGCWLAGTHDARFLVTSRERLRLEGEVVMALEPLDPASEGLKLFELRAQAQRPGFVIDESTRAQVERIVRRLDGLPLAIELAASRLRMMTLAQLERRLDDRFRVLVGGNRGRHMTLVATLDWSWELLEHYEQSTLAQASVFDGGFTLEAAEAVIDGPGDDPSGSVLDVLQSLIDKSWLRVRVEGVVPRFEVSSTVQEYAASKLATISQASPARPSRDAAEAAHGMYFAALGSRESIERLDLVDEEDHRRSFRAELDNFVVACRRAARRGEEDVAVSAYAATMAALQVRVGRVGVVSLGQRVIEIVRNPENRSRVDVVLAMAKRIAGDTKGARSHLETALAEVHGRGDRRREGHVLASLGRVELELGETSRAYRSFSDALDVARSAGCPIVEGVALRGLGNIDRAKGQLPEARRKHEDALAIFRRVGALREEGFTLVALGNLARVEGNYEEARGCLWRALEIHRRFGDPRARSMVLSALGIVSSLQGQLDDARNRFEAAMAIARDTGDRIDEAVAMNNLGNIAEMQGRIEDARDLFQRALHIYRESGERSRVAIALLNLSSTHRRLGRLEPARECVQDALLMFRELGERLREGVALSSLAEIDREDGRLEQAITGFEAALAIHRLTGNRRLEGMVLRDLGDIHAERGSLDVGLRCVEEGVSILRDVEAISELAAAVAVMGRVQLRRGELDGARASLEEAEHMVRMQGIETSSDLRLGIEALREALDDPAP